MLLEHTPLSLAILTAGVLVGVLLRCLLCRQRQARSAAPQPKAKAE